MGIYGDYLNELRSNPNGIAYLESLRKKQLGIIRKLRGHDVLVIASDFAGRPEKSQVRPTIDRTDKDAVADQLASITSDDLDVILETPGGSAEAAEDLVNMLRDHCSGNISFIIPGAAMSAGTIMVMSGDEILMGPNSSLGPIDAQLFIGNKTISADACLKGLNTIKDEVVRNGYLNSAYIPILQGLSPGEIHSWQNAQDFSFRLVSGWLQNYKFRNWTVHSSTNQAVTDEDRQIRAEQIANQLRNHQHWLTHGRSIRLSDLKEMKLTVTDYSKHVELNDAITRYYTLMSIFFEVTLAFKLFETPTSHLIRFVQPVHQPIAAPYRIVDFSCRQCNASIKMQCNFNGNITTLDGMTPFPKDSQLVCPQCRHNNDLTQLRKQIEQDNGKVIL